MSFKFSGIDHIQLAAPEGCETEARRFFADLLGWTEISEPENLQKRGGVWFQCGVHQVHIGVHKDFVPAKKAHPAFHVQKLDDLRKYLNKIGDCEGYEHGLFHPEDQVTRAEFIKMVVVGEMQLPCTAYSSCRCSANILTKKYAKDIRAHKQQIFSTLSTMSTKHH